MPPTLLSDAWRAARGTSTVHHFSSIVHVHMRMCQRWSHPGPQYTLDKGFIPYQRLIGRMRQLLLTVRWFKQTKSPPLFSGS